MDDLVDINYRIRAGRDALSAGVRTLPIDAGLSHPAPFVERAERDCFTAALLELGAIVGPAARVLDWGFFANSNLVSILGALDRPKALIVLSPDRDARLQDRLREAQTTAEVSFVDHDPRHPHWPLEAIGAGRTLVTIGGGSFGLLDKKPGFEALENASTALETGDLLLLTVEHPRDVAVLEVSYQDYAAQAITNLLTQIGRAEGLEPRSFYNAPAGALKLGAVAISDDTSIAWNGTKCALGKGDYLDMGAIAFFSFDAGADLHPDFEVEKQWLSQDQTLSLLLLRKT